MLAEAIKGSAIPARWDESHDTDAQQRRAAEAKAIGAFTVDTNQLPLDVVRWGVIAVVLYTALTLIRSASEDRRALAAARATSPA